MKLQVTVEVDEEQLREFFRRAGEDEPNGEAAPRPAGDGVELPAAWRFVEERHRVRYTWGDGQFDLYDPFVVFEADISTGTVRLGIGKCDRTPVHGDDRLYYIVCLIGPQGGLRAI